MVVAMKITELVLPPFTSRPSAHWPAENQGCLATMNPSDQTKQPMPPRDGEVDEVIELTEVVEEAPAEATQETAPEMEDDGTAEVVLDYRPESEGLASLKSPAEAGEQPAASPAAPREESLDDFLASLPELPEDLDISPEAPPPPRPQVQDLPQDLAQRLSDAELEDMVRQVVQETVDRLARELFPQMAAGAIERELNLIKKRLTEPD